MVEQCYRRDGWPLCPRCGEDELASDLMLGWNGDPPRPTLAECFTWPFYCYRCQWRGRVVPSRSVIFNG